MADLDGTALDDTIYGTSEDDLIEGQDGDDALLGSGGHDDLYGGKGNDTVDAFGGSGTLDMGGGDDTVSLNFEWGLEVTGGAGNDLFRIADFDHFQDSSAALTDFGAGDVIDLTAVLPYLTGWDGLTNPFAAGYLRLQQDGAHVLL